MREIKSGIMALKSEEVKRGFSLAFLDGGGTLIKNIMGIMLTKRSEDASKVRR